tara:strand:- start:208 stop:639 length:432 start_codon:yes stop_codon:yes gene_type:complete
MKKNQNKENVIAVVVLSAIFGLFVFLKLNPEQNELANTKTRNIPNIVEEKSTEIIEEVIQAEILLEDSNKKNNDNEVAQNVELFNDKELNRALSYVKKRWAPDNTINMAAWNHAKQIKITQSSENNSTSKEPENKTQLALISK